MVEILKLKTGSRYEDLASYSRLVSVDDWIFVSNTAGRNPLTQEIPEDVTEQTEQVLANIERALLAVDASLGDVVASRIFIGHGPRTLPDKTIPWFGDSKLSSAGGEDVGAARRLDVIPGVFRAGLRLIGDLNSIWRVSFWRGRDFQQWREGCGRSSCLCPARRDSGLAGL